MNVPADVIAIFNRKTFMPVFGLWISFANWTMANV